jgi:transcriptional regulator with XRE-family HTH domain
MERLSTEALEAVGSEVRRRRQAARLSMEGLATLALLSKNYVNKIELGQADLSLSALFSIAKALDCAVTDLFPSQERPLPPDVQAAMRLLSSSDPRLRRVMIAVLRRVRRRSGSAER